MAFRDLHTIPLMFRELSGVDQLEEELYQAELRRRGWYWSIDAAHRQLVRQSQRSYQKQPRVRACEANRMQRRRMALARGVARDQLERVLREQTAAGRALNRMFELKETP